MPNALLSLAVFNKYFVSVPGPSWPNHLFSQSATSCGIDDNIMYNKCGGPYAQFPQMTIFDSLSMANVPFSIFVNDTCGPSTNQSCGDVDPGWGTNTGTNSSTGLDPDVTMAGVARHKLRFFSHSLFYEQAAAGALPAFSWISPAHEASPTTAPLSTCLTASLPPPALRRTTYNAGLRPPVLRPGQGRAAAQGQSIA